MCSAPQGARAGPPPTRSWAARRADGPAAGTSAPRGSQGDHLTDRLRPVQGHPAGEDATQTPAHDAYRLPVPLRELVHQQGQPVHHRLGGPPVAAQLPTAPGSRAGGSTGAGPWWRRRWPAGRAGPAPGGPPPGGDQPEARPSYGPSDITTVRGPRNRRRTSTRSSRPPHRRRSAPHFRPRRYRCSSPAHPRPRARTRMCARP